MKNRNISILLIVLMIIVIAVIIVEYSSSKIDHRSENIYELNTDEFKHVNKDLIHYKEIKQIVTGEEKSKDIFCFSDMIYLLTETQIKVLDFNGILQKKLILNADPRCLFVNNKIIITAYRNYFDILSHDGDLICKSDTGNKRSVFTSVSTKDSLIFIADAGNRKVFIYNSNGKYISDFNGSSDEDSKNEFVVPSPYFDLAVNSFGELWVANPGMHKFQQHSVTGRLEGFWEKQSTEIDGFTGCCNPAQFAFLPDGSFITSEKKIVRIKIYKPSGEFECVVAAPDKFEDEGHAPAVSCDNNGNIIALDFDKNLIRVFEKI